MIERWSMRIGTKLVILDFVCGLLTWAWISATIATVYFLYGILASEQSWFGLIWPVGIGVVARQLSCIVDKQRRRVNFVDQLMRRGLGHTDAEAAWWTASQGGSNLLSNLQQVEISEQINRLEPAISAANSDSGDE